MAKKVHGTFSSHGLLRGCEGAKGADRLPWLPQELWESIDQSIFTVPWR
ncbi:hypothetical protein PY092_10420 [Muricauda sp. 334s03]|uniref:Uncharacterized protein n=1 Tax=Flagellimonas yonaguniensis TaxID=3031325 RepID=A0ABT5XZP0_9FLAO|nr:hypothetical protein [[Muricauda] yonaguniensis]